MKIEIFGPGCVRCKETEKNVRHALLSLGVEAEVVKVQDVKEFAKRGVMFTPGLAIEGEVKCAGRIPSSAEITTWITTNLMKSES
jgi:small redox-active disulfide protein 2